MLLAENNIPPAFANKLNAILPSISPDSKIAKEYKMGKTKTNCILNESVVPHFLQQTVDIMKTDFYSLSKDGSNDTEIQKMNPRTVRLFDISTSMFNTRFLDMCCTTGQTSGTSPKIFQKIDDVMTKLKLSWSNCVGFSVDNTSSNLGVRNPMKTRVILKNENCYFMGCPYHVVNYTTHKESVGFTRVTKFDIEDFALTFFFTLIKVQNERIFFKALQNLILTVIF